MPVVGKSQERTPFKHFLLDAMVGKVSGSLATGSPKMVAVPPLLCVDLCAGNGVDDDISGSSPSIFQKHCMHPCGRRNKATLTLIERDPANYDKLAQNVEANDWTTLINGDAREYSLPVGLSSKQAVFIHCDPNNVHETPLTEAFVKSWTKCTTYLVTLGCNAGGVKRLPLEHRRPWFEYVSMLQVNLPSHHDLILFRLIRDASQWAYAMNSPKAWSNQLLRCGVSKGNEIWPNGVEGISWRGERDKFNETVHQLFCTKKELGE